ncbi:MAG: hypothetical protein ACRDRI_27360 [Pseudonocardiaceae bacterium]
MQVSVCGTRTDDGAGCDLLAVREAGGTWMIHSLHAGAVRLSEEQAARMAASILHLVSPGAARAARAATSLHGDPGDVVCLSPVRAR